MRLLAALLALLALTACSTGVADVTGTYTGTIRGPFDVPITLDLTEAAGIITGTGTVAGVGVSATGTRSEIRLTDAPGDIRLRGTFTSTTYAGNYIVDGSQTATFSMQRR